MKNETIKVQIELDVDLAEAILRGHNPSEADGAHLADAIRAAMPDLPQRTRPKPGDVVRVSAGSDDFEFLGMVGTVEFDDGSSVIPIAVRFASHARPRWFDVGELEALP